MPVLEGMMYAAMKVIDEAPSRTLMDVRWLKVTTFSETSVGVRPCRECGGIVIEIVDTDLEHLAYRRNRKDTVTEPEPETKPQSVLIGFRAVYVFERLSRDLQLRFYALG